MIEFNRKYSDALKQGKKCLTLNESLALHKIPNETMIVEYLSQQIEENKGVEYPENFFTKENLFNTNYHDISFRDFEKYLYFAELSEHNTESGRVMLKKILNDSEQSIDLPIMVRGRNKIYWQLSGNLVMMAFKVLGLFPIIREISIDANIIP